MKLDRNYDLTSVLKAEHAGKWVALTSDRRKVVDYSDSFKELENRVGRKGIVYIKALDRKVRYAF